MTSKVVLITGASSGFGLMTARHIALAGHRVYASMLQEEPAAIQAFKQLKSKHPIKHILLDVTSEQSCIDAVKEVLTDAKQIDIVIHNAGAMCYGPAESFSPDTFIKYFDINCVGTQRLNRAFLPHMRARREGLIIWNGSSSTRGGTPPFLAPYFAAKAAMDSLAVSYSTELSRFGIETSIIVPGAFTSGTNHFAHAGEPDSRDVAAEYLGEGKPYHGVGEEILKRLSGLEPSWADPEEVARQIAKVVGMEAGTRPFRVHVDPSNDGSEAVNEVADRKRQEFYQRLGMEELLKPAQT